MVVGESSALFKLLNIALFVSSKGVDPLPLRTLFAKILNVHKEEKYFKLFFLYINRNLYWAAYGSQLYNILKSFMK